MSDGNTDVRKNPYSFQQQGSRVVGSASGYLNIQSVKKRLCEDLFMHVVYLDM